MDKMKRLLMIGAVVYAVTDCAKIPVIEERDSAGGANVTLSVEEARSYFETEYPSLFVTKSDDTATEGWMSPGDITPKWEEAVASAKGNTASVDVPIIPTYRYRAIRSEYSGGRAKAYSVDVWQKLVIVRKHYEDGGEEKMGQYILTLIPDKGYAGRHKGNVAEKFVNNGYNGSYSGLAVYYCRGVPMRMDRYVDGQKVGGISVFGETDAEIFASRLKMIFKELGTIKFLKGRVLLTRSGEDSWDYDYQDYYYLFDDIYIGDDGDFYFDSDGDGEVDSGYIWPGDPIEPEDPDPWEEEEEEEDEWWPPVEPEEEDDGYYDDGYWWTPDDNNTTKPEKPATGTPSTLSEHYGKESYYSQRMADFNKRYPGMTAPSYYTEYGLKYCKVFKDDTRPKLSDIGKEWVDKTMVALQVKLSEILINNPDIELDPALLEEMAFESHVDAYIECGILSLPMSDKIEILMTVDYDDLVIKEVGREQALEVMGEQVKYYLSHPDTAVEDAWYIMNNIGTIVDKIQEYVPGTKSGYNPEKEVFDLLFGQLIDYYEENVPGFSLPEIY